jgi:hypothetical protein
MAREMRPISQPNWILLEADVIAVGECEVKDADREACPEHAPGKAQASVAALHPGE